MAAEDVTRFLEAIDRDASLQERLRLAVEGAGDHLAAIAAIGRSEGYAFTDEDLKAAVERMSRELKDDELAQVSGGFGAGTISPDLSRQMTTRNIPTLPTLFGTIKM